MKDWTIPLPSLRKQAEIVALVDSQELSLMPAVAIELSNLRQSILHTACTGRLVPQDPADEPAAALLARLRAAPPSARRARLTRRPARV